ncbi:MAG: hypothetical protein AMS27_15915 [Bacteroides sp. SM23_62_1]|nr:MAG: hypothetical protein AMS27_15915 [Bacteroides sp. SM23_62_1]
MENLENKIMKNRPEFDFHEPGEGHFDRFARKLRYNAPERRFNIPYYLKIAAVILFVSISSILTYEYIRPANRSSYQYTFGMLSPEYREVEDFFIHTINTRYDRLEDLNTGDAEQKEMILKELKEMDEVLHSLSEELKNDPNNDRLINAMIQHYQVKLEIMNAIIAQLEEIKQITSKTNKHEGKEI